MFDFLLTHNYTENPTGFGILITVLSSFFLASLVAITYQITTPEVKKSNNFLQSMVLIAIVAAMVMQAIGDSLARGLGMLGALAIIRFRTKLDNPRNIAFMFAALANGIACGVYGFTIAFIGTIGFCVVALILKISKIGTPEILIGSLKFDTDMDVVVYDTMTKILKKHCADYKLLSEKYNNLNRLKSVKNVEGEVVDRIKANITKEYSYRIKLKNLKQSKLLAEALDELDMISDVRLRFGEIETYL